MKHGINWGRNSLGILVIALAFGLAIAGCDNGSTSSGDVTWTLEQAGGVTGAGGVPTSSSTGIRIRFNRDVPNLLDHEVTITGAAQKSGGTFEKSGNTWTIPINVNTSGPTTVSISRTGVRPGPSSVTVYLEGEQLPTTITITGLNAYNGSLIAELMLSESQDFMNEGLGVGGEATVQNGTATIALYDGRNERPWIGSGSWFVAFVIEADNFFRYEIFVSTDTVNFNTTNPSRALSGFRKPALSFTFGDIIEVLYWEGGITIPPNVTTLNALFGAGGWEGYDAWSTEVGIQLYTNQAMTMSFTGTTQLNPGTPIFAEVNHFSVAGSILRGPKIGEITGTITLTDIPSPPPGNVEIAMRRATDEGSNIWARINTSGITGSTATFNWSLPVHAVHNFTPGEYRFQLNASITGRRMWFDIPGTVTINTLANVGNIGTVSIRTVTLSGTITVTFNGNRVRFVSIDARTESGSSGSTSLSSPGPFAAWSITMPAFATTENVRFSVSGYGGPDEDWNWLFSRDLATPVMPVWNQDIPGIVLNLGNITEP